MKVNADVGSCYNLFYFFSNISRVVLYYEMKKKHISVSFYKVELQVG